MRFATMCADYGATCNEPKEDENGWDHIVEFPAPLRPGLPADLQHALPAALVQTKSHESDGLNVTLSLSNALKFARSPNPCFIALMPWPEGAPAPTFYAVHFWEELIGRTLKRARQASADGVAEADFNHLTLSFTMGEADLHTDDLVGWIERQIRDHGPDYAAVKATLRRTLGFDGPVFSAEIEFDADATVEAIVDHQLGLTPTIGVRAIRFNQRRFDIQLPMPMPQGEIAYARMTANPAARSIVQLRGPDGRQFSLEGDLIVPAIRDLPDALQKVRIRTDLLDIVWAPAGTASITASINIADRKAPGEIEKMAWVMVWSGEGPIDVKVSVEDDRMLGATAQLATQPDGDLWRLVAERAGTLATLAAHRKVPPLVSVADIDRAEWLGLLDLFVGGQTMQANAPFPSGEAPPIVDRALTFGLAPVGDWIFGAIMNWTIASQEVANGRWAIDFADPQLLEPICFADDDAAALDLFKADYRRLATQPGALPLDNALVALRRAIETD
ncbi:MAG: hypothetical protein JWR80_8588 [Bradyrhizobium sp.]|nr:hypothetical protein [Bradyrhizobium sp.]